MMEKLWPAIATIRHTKISIQKLINDVHKDIAKYFLTNALIEDNNEVSVHAAAALWRPLKSNEMQTRDERNRVNIQSYNNLMEILDSVLKRDTL
jgi:hypothetical protein